METAEDAYGETIRVGDAVVFNYGGLMRGRVISIKRRVLYGRVTKELTIEGAPSVSNRYLQDRFLTKQKDSRATVKI